VMESIEISDRDEGLNNSSVWFNNQENLICL
jgi:hypothetical protein